MIISTTPIPSLSGSQILGNDWLGVAAGRLSQEIDSHTFDQLGRAALTETVKGLPTNSAGQVEFNTLLTRMCGIFPSELVSLLKYCQVDYSIDSQEKARASTIVKQGWHELADYVGLPPPHLANYEWRFTQEAATLIVDYIKDSTKPSDCKICCLGTPTVALDLVRQNLAESVTLLDINAPVIHCIDHTLGDEGIVSAIYDVQSPLPKRFSGCFNVVVADPPWYIDYYKAFLSRAISLLTPAGGVVLCPVFYPLTRHKAAADLYKLRQWLAEMGCISSIYIGEVRFEMPEFERATLQALNIQNLQHDWRRAALYAFGFTVSKRPLVEGHIEIESQKWHRLSTQSETLVISEQGVLAVAKYNAGNRTDIVWKDLGILPTISRSDLSKERFDIWDSGNRVRIVQPQDSLVIG